MNGLSVPMIFSPQNCSLAILDKILTPDRRKLATKLLEQIKNGLNTRTSHHNLLIGPRGSGKTHVLTFIRKTLEAAYANNDELKIIRLSEEERGITTLLDFLLACFRAFGITRQEIALRIRDEKNITPQEAAVDYFDEITGKNPTLIIVENLAYLFNCMEESAISDLRGFSQARPFVSLLASSVSLFADSSRTDHPFYGFFNIHPLQQLTPQDARKYLLTLAQTKKDKNLVSALRKTKSQARVNAIYDLTGGNHRLLAMLSDFLSADGLAELVGPFVHMADRELIPYYQQRLDRLSAQQNKILITIADHHGRALNVNEISHYTFLPSTTVSRQLYDLLHGGYVDRKQKGRESFYDLREPLLRLVLDIKDGRDRPLPLIVNLLKDWYEVRELKELERSVPERTRDYYLAALKKKQFFKDTLEAYFIEGEVQKGKVPEESDLYKKAMKFFQDKQYSKAIQGFEKLLREDPLNGPVLFNLALALQLSGRKKESLKAYENIIKLLGDSKELKNQVQVARVLVNKGVTLAILKRPEEALSVYDQVARRFGGSKEFELQVQVARALVNKGITLVEFERSKEAISVCDQVVKRFSASKEPELQEGVARTLLSKGVTLGELERPEEEINVYNQVVKMFGANKEPELQAQVARALVNKGYRLGRLERPEEALNAYDKAVKMFGANKKPELQEGVAGALVNKGNTLRELERLEEAINVYDQVVKIFGASKELALQEGVAGVLINKGNILGELEQPEEAISVYDQVVKMFGASKQPDLQVHVAGALVYKGYTLGILERPDEAISAYDQVVKMFGVSKDPELQVRVARALNNKGFIMLGFENAAEALAIFNTALQTQPDFSPALLGKVIALMKNRQEDEAIDYLSEALEKIPPHNEIRKFIIFKLIDLLIHDEKRLRRVVEIYQEDQNSLIAGLIRWVQDQVPISKEKAETLENTYKTLESVFKGISEAEPALQLLHAARLDALGDSKALLNLPREMRQLIKKNEE
ncbi:MAG: tetratricopeptide repeat protein [Deltaproteobacteria bacterium]|nr:tetratricopeptide repeat protein [Deltaproteobacteria bacterium]